MKARNPPNAFLINLCFLLGNSNLSLSRTNCVAISSSDNLGLTFVVFTLRLLSLPSGARFQEALPQTVLQVSIKPFQGASTSLRKGRGGLC